MSFTGNNTTVGNRGHSVIINTAYSTVQTVFSNFRRAPNNFHELSIINDRKTAITTIFNLLRTVFPTMVLTSNSDELLRGFFRK